jgi:glycosyltransferase involved in cell wall biosynthesis
VVDLTDVAPMQPAGSPLRTQARLLIAAATFNRPAGLKLLLDHIETLVFDGPMPAISMVIVDNSIDGNARTAVEARAQGFRFPLFYSHQTERGIAQARNRALDVAVEHDVDWMAFIDDDEYPDPHWLARMMAIATETQATVVVGAVRGEFEAPPADWMIKGGFYSIERYAEGAELDFGNTSNVLFDFRFARQHGLRFDLAFALTGGEDTLFFHDALARGGRIVFCRSGIVYETIVPHRARFDWLVKRWTRSGNTDGRILMRSRPSLTTRWGAVLGGGAVRFAIGGGLALLTAPLALVGRAHVPVEHIRVASRGLGFMMSAFGSTIEEYRIMNR